MLASNIYIYIDTIFVIYISTFFINRNFSSPCKLLSIGVIYFFPLPCIHGAITPFNAEEV